MLKEFSFTSTGLNIIFHFCDSPSHGSQYHNGCNDSLEKIPKGTLENLIKKLYTKINRLTIFGISLTPSTAKMFNIMKANATEMTVIEKLNPSDFLSTVKASVFATVARHGQFVNSAKEEKKEKFKEEKKYETFKARRITYRVNNVPKEINSYSTNLLLEILN